MGIQLPRGRGTVEGGMCLPIVSALRISPAAAGECACPVHAADESIRRRQVWQGGNAAYCYITLDTC